MGELDELAELIRASGSAEKLLVLHAPGGDGRCPVCRAGGDGSGRVRSPCSLLLAARAAADRRPPAVGRRSSI